MPDELKPCPWPDCGKNEANLDSVVDRDMFEVWAVTCPDCGRSVEGADGSRQAAIAAWNALLRQPQATVYDGTPATLPPEGVRVAVKIKGATCSSGYVSEEPATKFWWIDSLQDFREIMIGDRWLPLPGGWE